MRRTTFSFLLGTCLLAPWALQGQTIPVDGYAALVADRIITVSDVMAMVQPIERQLKDRYEGPQLKEKMIEAYRDARDSLVERALIIVDFNEGKGSLPEQAIDSRMEEIIRERFNDDRASFLRALAEERMTVKEWREQIHDQLVISLLRRQEVNQRINISPSDLAKLYEERRDTYLVPEKVKLSMILLHKGETPEDQEVKTAEAAQLLESLRAGEEFATLAKTASEGSKASRGGDWGWVDPSILKPGLAEAMAELETGQFSDVLEIGDELYILKIDGRQQASVLSYEEVQEELENELRQVEADRLYQAWVSRLKNKYYVKIY